MAQVIVRNLDDGVVERLKERAVLHRHSLEQELRETLTEVSRPRRREVVAEAARIRAMTPKAALPDPVALIREDRDSR